jgi:predicted transcriptional regulator
VFSQVNVPVQSETVFCSRFVIHGKERQMNLDDLIALLEEMKMETDTIKKMLRLETDYIIPALTDLAQQISREEQKIKYKVVD